jgi:hypothetical protein
MAAKNHGLGFKGLGEFPKIRQRSGVPGLLSPWKENG